MTGTWTLRPCLAREMLDEVKRQSRWREEVLDLRWSRATQVAKYLRYVLQMPGICARYMYTRSKYIAKKGYLGSAVQRYAHSRKIFGRSMRAKPEARVDMGYIPTTSNNDKVGK